MLMRELTESLAAALLLNTSWVSQPLNVPAGITTSVPRIRNGS